ncbi:hypothetical protein COU60_03180 [Candidatus Pacearchaeota archaeon CG10_big_fil_rev_8_21_14_0_10_34_76]|nr:MAG: hypothetical protein COU60_03180 [Candidatus Pacearchaeota archaeon CG10_big_fil_rev_8_21_14_0_10_34_76]
MKNKNIDVMEHTSEVKFKVRGSSINKVFENIVIAISDFMARGEKIKPVLKKKIKISGEDNESLLYDFLDEIIYLGDAEGFVVSKAHVKIKGKNLEAELLGDNTNNYPELDHIKAPTYSEMYVKQKVGKDSKKHWEAVFVLDV